jgi:hypothetical protein
MIEHRVIQVASESWMVILYFVGGALLPIFLLIKVYRLHFETLLGILIKWCTLLFLGGTIILTLLINLLGLGIRYLW